MKLACDEEADPVLDRATRVVSVYEYQWDPAALWMRTRIQIVQETFQVAHPR